MPDAAETVAVGDIGPDTDWSRALEGIDAVAHLAARVHVMKDTAADPLAAFRAVNTDGTRRLAEQAAASGVRRFVYRVEASQDTAQVVETAVTLYLAGMPAVYRSLGLTPG